MKMKMNMKKRITKFIPYIIFILIMTITGILSDKYVQNTNAATTSFETTLKTFPPSYRDALTALHEAHPNWTFEAVNTGLDWNTVIANEMVWRRNLVPNTIMTLKGVDSGWYSTPTSWKDYTYHSGSFNWATNNWEILSDPYWVQASKKSVEYVMDPRNWLTENNIFMFEQISYDSSYQTYSLLKAMMEDTFMDCDYAKVGGTSKTYATVLIEAGQKYNISPISLCARLFQEKGRGTYNSSTGKYVLNDTLATGLATSDGGKTFHAAGAGETKYYNFFNIGAYGTTMQDIFNNGGKEAYTNGWTTQYLAIMGGAQKIANSKNNVGQDTLYFHKFSVVNEEYLYWNQYMQNLTAPVNEGYNSMVAYTQNGALESPFHFRIPVYTNMPYPAVNRPVPKLNSYSPNYKLSSLTVTGITIENVEVPHDIGFNMDVKEYSIEVPFTTKHISVNGTAIASDTTEVTGNGVYELKVGNNPIEITIKTLYGNTGKYVVNVERGMDVNLVSVSTIDFTMKGTGSVQLGWDKVPDATGYYVYRALPGGAYSFIGGTLNTSYTDQTAECGTTYFYRVVAFVKTSDGTIVKGNPSAGASVKARPETPKITGTERLSETTAKVTWNAVSGANGYYVYRALPGGSYSFVGGTLSSQYTDKNVEPGATYFYKVVAFKKVNNTIVKGNASAAVKILSSVPQITGISASSGGTANITISRVTGATGYYIYRTTLGGQYMYVGQTTGTQYTDSGLVTGTSYYYKVIAYTYSGDALCTTGYSSYKAIKAK